ncbi:MAG: GNAT family N-acetyltransferase [Acidobacteria bacterium]|nr:GNAT family N-acetyltransferase [Acidobacteriota bacterium]
MAPSIIEIDAFEHNYSIELVESTEGFYSLQAEWDLLTEDCPRAVVFQCWTWNWVWWKHLAPAGSRLCIVTCRNGSGELAGLAPFYVYPYRILSRTYFSQLRFIGTDPDVLTGEYLDILVRRSDSEQEVAGLIAETLKNRVHWDSFWFNLLLPDSAASRYLVSCLCTIRVSRTESISYQIDTGGDWQAYFASRSRKSRKNFRYLSKRALERQQACFREIIDARERGTALECLEAFQKARWKRWSQTGAPGAFMIPGFRPFLQGMMEECRKRGQMRLWALFHGEKISAVLVVFIENGAAHAFQMGFDSRYERDSPGFVLLGLCIRACFMDPAIHSFDMLSGSGKFKSIWTIKAQTRFIYSGGKRNWRNLVFEGMKALFRAAKTAARFFLPDAVVLWMKVRLMRMRRTR